MPFCINCGKEIDSGAKFCSECGAAVNDINSHSQRKQVYDGEIHKCPNCGELLSAFSVICPACGYEVRGGKASNSVRDFAARLADIQSDTHKATLIQSFPIPNSKEDILEFMILAATCFDVGENLTGNGVKKEISDAWLAKVEQSYQKAKLLFANDADFSKIQNVYDQTYHKIKASVIARNKKRVAQLFLRTIGLWGGVSIFIIGFILDISSFSTDTSVFHVCGMAIMIIGALMIGKKSGELLDVGVGAVSGVFVLLLGMLLEENFHGNGSAMVLSGGVTLIIVVVQLVRTSAKR